MKLRSEPKPHNLQQFLEIEQISFMKQHSEYTPPNFEHFWQSLLIVFLFRNWIQKLRYWSREGSVKAIKGSRLCALENISPT